MTEPVPTQPQLVPRTVAVVGALLVLSVVAAFVVAGDGDTQAKPAPAPSTTPPGTSPPATPVTPTTPGGPGRPGQDRPPPEETGSSGVPQRHQEIRVSQVSMAGHRPVACAPGVRITFSAVLTSTGTPAPVRYRWVHSDGAAADGTLRFTAGGPRQQTVTHEWAVSAEPGAGSERWIRLDVLEPAPASAGATFAVACPSVSAGMVAVGCTDRRIRSTAVITVSAGPVTVSYRWHHADGTSGPLLTADFPAAGGQERQVADEWRPIDWNGPEAVELEITDPITWRSTPTATSTTCVQPSLPPGWGAA